MRVITYLGFTILSIFIQFSVMDFIQEKIQINNKPSISNITHQEKVAYGLLKNITSKPHALYYKMQMSKSLRRLPPDMNRLSERIYSNLSVPAVPLGTTDITTTIFDILYDENTSDTESTSTTESFFTTTEFDNVTEIALFETKNKSSTLPSIVPKHSDSKYCGCNLLYKVCDINCCCDPDCNNNELKYFQCEKEHHKIYGDGCISHLLDSNVEYGSSMLDNLFCVVKTNLPDKRSIKKPNLAMISQNKWKHIQQKQTLYEFKKALYKQSDPIWLLKNATIYYLDFPTSMINNYCNDRTPIEFLKDEKISCMVKLEDLEMFHISRTSAESMVISAIESTFNSSVLNCSNLHCINWTILACSNGVCKNYNQSLHEASCTDVTCINLALKISYYFHYYDNKIINATIQLHIQNISNMIPFVMQDVTVKFIMANRSLNDVIEFSGNPGYLSYLPVIVSYAKNNLTDTFFNVSMDYEKYLILPENHNGVCVLSNTSHKFLVFGLNKRMKCRYVHRHSNVTQNSTSMCRSIQNNINDLLGLNKDVFISPFGNPYGVKDDNWLKLQTNINEQEPLYGTYNKNMVKLHCYNMINRISIVFIYANVDEEDFKNQNKILLAKYEVVANNASFNLEDVSTVLTVDISFLDASNPNLYVYAGSPHLNVHLPKDFFFPFSPNKAFYLSNSYTMTIYCYVILFFANKITLE